MDKALRDDALKLAPHALRTWIGYTRNMERDLEKVGLNLPQYGVLAILAEKGKMRMGALGRELSVTMGAATNITDLLVNAGLVARSRDTEDRRVVFVEITDKGRAALKSATGVAVDYLALCMADLDAAERKAYVEGQQKVAAKIAAATPGRAAAK